MRVIKKEKKKKREKERKRERNLPPHPCSQTCPYTAKAICTCQMATLQGEEGCPSHVPMPRSSPSVATLRPGARSSGSACLRQAKGLTPSSCSPDAGSGIHICVIINLGVSAGDGEGGSICVPPPPSSLPPSNKRVAAKRGCGEGERGSSPGAAGSLPTDSQGDELGGRQESLAIFHPACPRFASRGLGRPRGRQTPGGAEPEWVSLNGAGP